MIHRMHFWNSKPLCLIFKLIKYLGMLPLEFKLEKNYLKCHISKLWLCISFFYMIICVLYSVMTIYSAFHLFYHKHEQSIFDFVQMTSELLEILQLNMNYIFSIIFLKDITKMLEKIFAFPLSCNVKKISKKLTIFIIFVFVVYFIFTLRIVLILWIYEPSKATKVKTIAFKGFNDCKVGITTRTITNILRDAPIILMCTICLLISNMFDDIADTLKLNLNFKIVLYKGKLENNRLENKINNVDIKYFVEQNNKFRLAIKCVKKLNQLFGIQLFANVSSNLFSMIFFIFRQVSKHSDNIPAFRNIIGAFSQFGHLLIIIWIGNVLKIKSQKPLEVLQEADILYLPSNLQVQIQTLFFQWSTTGPGYLSPFNIMKIETALLASVITNFITYLMILIQYDR